MGWRLKKVHHVPEGCGLTERQFECVALLGEGLSYDQIGQVLGVSTSTVRSHLHQAYRTLDVVGGAQAVAAMGERGWLGWRAPRLVRRVPPIAMRAPFLHAYLRSWAAAGYPLSKSQEVPAHLEASMRLALLGHRLVVDR